MDADRIIDHARITGLVRENRVQVVDLADTVAAETQRIRVPAEKEFARVEIVLPIPGRGRVGIWHDHLRDRCPIQHRPLLIAVAVTNVTQNKTLAGVEADLQRPPRPPDLLALNGEARPLRLGDLNRLQTFECGTDLSGIVKVSRLIRYREDFVIGDGDHGSGG